MFKRIVFLTLALLFFAGCKLIFGPYTYKVDVEEWRDDPEINPTGKCYYAYDDKSYPEYEGYTEIIPGETTHFEFEGSEKVMSLCVFYDENDNVQYDTGDIAIFDSRITPRQNYFTFDY